jgi:glutaredoxin 2
MKLYHSASSPNSRRVRIFLAEKGLPIPLVTVDLGKGEQHSNAYRAITPRRVVPTLVLEDGTAIGEVPAICRYIEETYATPPLLGETAKEKPWWRCGNGVPNWKVLLRSWKRSAIPHPVSKAARSPDLMITSRFPSWQNAASSG